VRVQFGEYTYDGDAREVRQSNERLHLTPKAFELLGILIRERPRAVSKQELRDELWPEVVVEEANLKNLVVEIRSALGAAAVRTVHRYGYAFNSSDEAATLAARLVHPGDIYKLRFGDNIIGRDKVCSVILGTPGVSRRHATIHIAPDGITIEDLGSKNGTWKNGKRLESRVELRDGDHIRIGGLSMVFRSTAAADSTVTVDENL
jgi:hypothetical protein